MMRIEDADGVYVELQQKTSTQLNAALNYEKKNYGKHTALK